MTALLLIRATLGQFSEFSRNGVTYHDCVLELGGVFDSQLAFGEACCLEQGSSQDYCAFLKPEKPQLQLSRSSALGEEDLIAMNGDWEKWFEAMEYSAPNWKYNHLYLHNTGDADLTIYRAAGQVNQVSCPDPLTYQNWQTKCCDECRDHLRFDFPSVIRPGEYKDITILADFDGARNGYKVRGYVDIYSNDPVHPRFHFSVKLINGW